MTKQPQRAFFGKILIIAQWWAGDQDQMMALLKLIADLEPELSPYADFLTFPRWDTKTRDWRGVKALETKFKVIEGRSKRHGAGWPIGPNAVAMDAFKWTYAAWKENSFNYDAAFLIEADGLPLRRTWISELLAEWQSQQGLALGHWDGHGQANERGSHMNGNMMFHPKLVDNAMELAYGDVPQMGWDMKIWSKIRPYATPSRLIYSDYRLNTPKNPMGSCERLFEAKVHTHPNNPLVGEKLYPAYLHGVKGLEGINCMRCKNLLDN
jgi:hypothetical protein